MVTNKIYSLGFCVLCFGGCAPLEQAPLVYSSKIAVGVDVAATSTETPGVGVTIGYKQLDAAYVPVAVARKCEPLNDQNCSKDIFSILRLNGANNQGENGKQPTEAEIGAVSTEVARLSEESKIAQDAVESAEKNLANGKKKYAALAEEKTRAIAQLPPDAPNETRVALQKELDTAIQSSKNQPELQSLLETAKSERERVAAKLAKATEKYQNLIGASKPGNQNVKSDAFSVFGSFNADTNAGTEGEKKVGAGLRLGRIFSTGVASQNLTEGMMRHFALSTPGACIDRALQLLEHVDQASRAEIAKKLASTCELAQIVQK